ncbi:patatin-like phospholipase family protein [Clostridium ljungdahlii]|uniref:patatin-like phospholipase family protein n=1 Tax=Clostridium ljungdahlii TaxID=1538 RepID=UPI00386C23E4
MYKGIGLVLTGGGGKGAYHIGVWKALREYGIDKNITAISGTSVGILNGILFAQGNYNVAETVWKNISKDKILKLDMKKIILKLLEIGLIKGKWRL